MESLSNGVVWIRHANGRHPTFHGVFYEGVLQPEWFKSWMEAREHLVALLQQKIEAQPE